MSRSPVARANSRFNWRVFASFPASPDTALALLSFNVGSRASGNLEVAQRPSALTSITLGANRRTIRSGGAVAALRIARGWRAGLAKCLAAHEVLAKSLI